MISCCKLQFSSYTKSKYNIKLGVKHFHISTVSIVDRVLDSDSGFLVVSGSVIKDRSDTDQGARVGSQSRSN